MYIYRLSILVSLVLCSACVQSVPITYYHLPFVEQEFSEKARPALNLDVAVASYLDREPLLTRLSPVSFKVNDAELWGTPLERQLETYIKRNVEQTHSIQSRASRTLYLFVHQADVDSAGVASVRMEWGLTEERGKYEMCTASGASENVEARVALLAGAIQQCISKIVKHIQ